MEGDGEGELRARREGWGVGGGWGAEGVREEARRKVSVRS